MKNTVVAKARFCLNCGSPLRHGEVDREQRWHCSDASCDFVWWDNPVPVVAAIVRLQNKLLLARNAKWPHGIQSIISGYLEKGEAPQIAVVRELKEETGLAAERVTLLGLYMCHELNQVLMIYVIDAKGQIQLGPELVEYSLVTPEDIDPQVFGCRAEIESWQQMGMGVGPAMRDYLQIFHNID